MWCIVLLKWRIFQIFYLTPKSAFPRPTDNNFLLFQVSYHFSLFYLQNLPGTTQRLKLLTTSSKVPCCINTAPFSFSLLFSKCFFLQCVFAKPGSDLVLNTDEECVLSCIQLDDLKGSIFKKLVSHCHSRIYDGAKADIDTWWDTGEKVVTVDSAWSKTALLPDVCYTNHYF